MAKRKGELAKMGLDAKDIDLSRLGLEELEPERPSAGLDPLWWLLSLLGVGVLLWLPNTVWYRRASREAAAFWVMGMLALVIGVLLGRLVIRAASRARPLDLDEVQPPKPLSRLQRALIFIFVLAGTIFFAVFWPNLSVSRQPWGVYVPMIGAMILGAYAIRWLLSARPAQTSVEIKPVEWPPWVRWAALFVLVATGLTVMILSIGANRLSRQAEFGLSAVGFVVGLGIAIWLVRQFERLAKKARNRENL